MGTTAMRYIAFLAHSEFLTQTTGRNSAGDLLVVALGPE